MIAPLLSLKIYDALLIPLIGSKNLFSWVRFFSPDRNHAAPWANGIRGSAAQNNKSGAQRTELIDERERKVSARGQVSFKLYLCVCVCVCKCVCGRSLSLR
jgi:hypothetical protein